VTHSVNTDQRQVLLRVRYTSGTRYVLDLPADTGVLVPGSYLLFALDRQGTPSVAAWLTVS